MALCKKCGKNMPPIIEDVYLKHRGYHKRCWKELKEVQDNFLYSISGLSEQEQVQLTKEFKHNYNLANLL